MQALFRHILATSLLLAAPCALAAQSTQGPPPNSSKVGLQIAPELDHAWPQLRSEIGASSTAQIAEPADLILATGQEWDFAELQSSEQGYFGLYRVRLGRLSTGDAQGVLPRVLALLQRQKALLALAGGAASDAVTACKVNDQEPDKCLPDSVVESYGAMLATAVRNRSGEPKFIALLETSSALGISAIPLRGRETIVRLSAGERIVIPPAVEADVSGTVHEIVLVSDRPIDTSSLTQPSPYGSSATCFVRLYPDCVAKVPPLPSTTDLSAIGFTYGTTEEPGPAMGGGVMADRGDADWMVELYSMLPYSAEEIEADRKLPPEKRQYLAERSPEERAHACGGTMIAPDLVLTAAHCVATGRFLPPNEARIFHDRRVRIGSLRLGRGGETRAIDGVVVHAGYTGLGSGLPDDIALLLLKRDEPIHLAPRPLKIGSAIPTLGTTLTGLGWGYTHAVAPGTNIFVNTANQTQHNPDILQQAPLEVIAASDCSRRVDGKLRPGMLCLVTPKSVVASGGPATFSCRGDSGGPLVRNYGSTNEELVGLTSWSLGCGYKDTPSVYTDAAYFSRWVEAARKAIRSGAIIRVGDPARAN
jgi:hypothetical protein